MATPATATPNRGWKQAGPPPHRPAKKGGWPPGGHPLPKRLVNAARSSQASRFCGARTVTQTSGVALVKKASSQRRDRWRPIKPSEVVGTETCTSVQVLRRARPRQILNLGPAGAVLLQGAAEGVATRCPPRRIQLSDTAAQVPGFDSVALSQRQNTPTILRGHLRPTFTMIATNASVVG